MVRGLAIAGVFFACAGAVASSAEAAKAAHVVLRWEPVAGAASYELEIASDPQFSQVVVREKVAVTGYRWKELPTTVFHWRVRSIDQDGRTSPWSEVRRISPEVAPPRALKPARDGRVGCGTPCSVELSFEPQPLIERFAVEVARTPDFKGALRVESKSPVVRVELPALGQWFWRGTGVDVTGRALSTGETQSFVAIAGPPIPVSPAGGSVIAPGAVTLSWSGPDAYRRFELEVRSGSEKPARHEVEARSIQLAFDTPARVQWRVRAVIDPSTRSDWSAPSEFDVAPGAPTLVAPAHATELGTRRDATDVLLQWSGGVSTYVLQLSSTEDFAAPAEHRISGTEHRTALAVGRHFWRVIPEDERGIRGAPSEARSVAVIRLPPLASPQQVKPAVDDVFLDGQATFAWSSVADAARYELSLSGPSGEQVIATETETLTLTRALEPEGEYHWRIRAVDREGAAGPWSAATPFFVGPPPAVRAERVGAWPAEVVEGEEARVKVALFDRKGRPLSGVDVEASVQRPDEDAADSPGASARSSKATAAPANGEAYEIRFVAPAARGDHDVTELEIRERGFVLVERLPLARRPAALRLAAQVGVAHNLGGAGGPWVGAEGRARLPFFKDRFGAALRVGTWGGATDVPPSVGAPQPSVGYRVMPATLSLFGTHRLGSIELHGQVGAGVQYSWLETAHEAGGAFAPTGLVGLGAARKLGPGVLQLDASLGFGRAELAFGALRTGALIVSLGYGVEP